MASTTAAQPELASFGECRSCGERIGWVQPRDKKWVPVDPVPRPFGNLALLRGGVHAIPLDDPDVDERLKRYYDGPRFVLHFDTCDANGLRRVGWIVNKMGEGEPLREDPVREISSTPLEE